LDCDLASFVMYGTAYFYRMGLGAGASATQLLYVYTSDVNGYGVQLYNAAAAGGTPYSTIIQYGTTAYGLTGWPSALVIEAAANGGMTLSSYAGDFRIQSGVSRVVRMTVTNAGDLLFAGESLGYMIFADASAASENIALLTTAAPNWQSMDRGVFLGDSSTAPGAAPAGGVFIYGVSGDLHLYGPANKTLVLDQPVYQDINLGSALLAKPASSAPGSEKHLDSTGADTGIYALAFAPGEYVSGSFEMQHDYKEGTDITFHIHWQGIAAPAGGTDNVKWQLEYSLTRDGQTLQATTTITKESAITTQYAVVRSDFAAISGSTKGHGGGNIQIGDQFVFKLSRIAASADEYAGDALVITAGIHYQIDTLGSRSISAK
jgi:hypothetical protein